MGITGLLPLLEDIKRDINICEYKNKVVAVDAYVWLHQCAFGCAESLCTGVPTNQYVWSFIRKVKQLMHVGCKPYIVFDGARLPAKAATEESREAHRKKALSEGNFTSALDVNAEMARCVMQALKQINIPFVVAPYEADAQLAYLIYQGIADVVLTIDSDLIVYNCARVFYDMDSYGSGYEIMPVDLMKLETLSVFSHDNFLDACILSGCDYLKSIKKIGLKKAIALVDKYGSGIEAIVHLEENVAYNVPVGYASAYKHAKETFLHQTVYDISSKTLVPLTRIPNVETNLPLDHLGIIYENAVAVGVAEGDLHPETKLPFPPLVCSICIDAPIDPSHFSLLYLQFRGLAGKRKNKTKPKAVSKKKLSFFDYKF